MVIVVGAEQLRSGPGRRCPAGPGRGAPRRCTRPSSTPAIVSARFRALSACRRRCRSGRAPGRSRTPGAAAPPRSFTAAWKEGTVIPIPASSWGMRPSASWRRAHSRWACSIWGLPYSWAMVWAARMASADFWVNFSAFIKNHSFPGWVDGKWVFRNGAKAPDGAAPFTAKGRRRLHRRPCAMGGYKDLREKREEDMVIRGC